MARTNLITIALIAALIGFNACNGKSSKEEPRQEKIDTKKTSVFIEAESNHDAQGAIEATSQNNSKFIHLKEAGWIALDANIAQAGRYKIEIRTAKASDEEPIIWIEDYYDNKDDRTYNISGNIKIAAKQDSLVTVNRVGAPMNKGLHKIKLHTNNALKVDWVKFTMVKKYRETPRKMVQNTNGDEWSVVWADEFEGSKIDTTKWTFDEGNWGWGNYEPQYYTNHRKKNARIEDGNLIIEAHKNDMGQEWTSARLTTREKVSFQYGKIEFRAKVPAHRGNWAAGWTLGDDYIDELSWPYCGEIDILESVGYEMDNETGDGIAHASAHSGAYYFKLGNQPTATTPVENMNNKYHTYAVEWTPEYIKAFVDGNHYFTYDDNTTELSWPFDKPHNIILNLAMGGGWGGAQGIDETVTSQKMIIDYVRVYERK